MALGPEHGGGQEGRMRRGTECSDSGASRRSDGCCDTQVQWGQHSVAEAERRLFIAALHDRANRRFALLSES